MAEPSVEWTAGWAHDAEVKRQAWAALGPEQLLEWLDDALELAQQSGALARDRRRRAARAARWADPESRSTRDDDLASGA